MFHSGIAGHVYTDCALGTSTTHVKISQAETDKESSLPISRGCCFVHVFGLGVFQIDCKTSLEKELASVLSGCKCECAAACTIRSRTGHRQPMSGAEN